MKNLFWKDVFQGFKKLMELTEIDTAEKLLSLPCFHDRLKIGGTCYYNKNWYESGIRFINDFFDNDGSLYTLENLKHIYNININFLEYQSIKASLRGLVNTFDVNISEKLTTPFLPYYLQIILINKKGTKAFYDIFIKNRETVTGQVKWNKQYHFSEEDWRSIYEMPFAVTKCSKLQWFQYRINHKILATNNYLFKINIINSPICVFCNQEDETIEHLLWDCCIVQEFLHRVNNLLLDFNIQLPLNKKDFLFSIEDYKQKKLIQLIILEIKYYIYTARCLKQKPNTTALRHSLKMFYWIHKQLAISNGELDNFLVIWQCQEALIL